MEVALLMYNFQLNTLYIITDSNLVMLFREVTVVFSIY